MEYSTVYGLWADYSPQEGEYGQAQTILIRVYTHKQPAERKAEELNRVEARLAKRLNRGKCHHFVSEEQLASGENEYA